MVSYDPSEGLSFDTTGGNSKLFGSVLFSSVPDVSYSESMYAECTDQLFSHFSGGQVLFVESLPTDYQPFYVRASEGEDLIECTAEDVPIVSIPRGVNVWDLSIRDRLTHPMKSTFRWVSDEWLLQEIGREDLLVVEGI